MKPQLAKQVGVSYFWVMLEPPVHINKRGRNERLINKRNYILVCRFYFYSTLMNLKFSAVLALLEEEFFLSQARIADLLAENSELITSLELKKASVSELKDSYPFMSWQYNHAKRCQNGGQIPLDLF
ncbi:hypothetical protein L1275_003092 [Flavobacterium sp. HSC-61S13]|nr:hypothetical protein [Flavobacterium sp. HSC-61S13]